MLCTVELWIGSIDIFASLSQNNFVEGFFVYHGAKFGRQCKVESGITVWNIESSINSSLPLFLTYYTSLLSEVRVTGEFIPGI